MRRLLLAVVAVIFSGAVFAQDDSLFIRRLADEILLHSTAYDNLHTLTKKIGGRINGSPQTYLAVKWGEAALAAAGADKVYRQACQIPHWVRGGKDEVVLVSGNRDPLYALALGNSIGTPAGGITAPAILVRSFDEIEQKKDQLKGKIVFINYPFNATYVETFHAYGDAVRYRALGASLVAKYGAVGMVIRSMSESTDNFPHTGAMRYNDSFPKIPALAVGLQDADRIARALASGNASLYIKTHAHTLPDTTGYNVVGELTGENPSEVITVGGHLDSWDPAEGAHDDGTGVCHSIEVLRALRAVGYKPKHTIRVVLFADEENGGHGADKYLEELIAKKEKPVFSLESDAGGFTPRAFSVNLTGDALAKARTWLPLLQPYGVYEFVPGGGGADVEGIGKSLQAPVGELLPDSQRYFDYHHTPNDVFENVNKRELELGAINMAALIYLVDKYGF